MLSLAIEKIPFGSICVITAVLVSAGTACAPAAPPPPPPPPPPAIMAVQVPIGSTLVENFSDGENWMLHRDLVYRIGTTDFAVTVPAGFVTDYASVPRLFHILLGTTGPYSGAAVVHDYLYWVQSCTRLQADNILDLAMREGKVGWPQRFAIYRAVRLGGGVAWEANRAERAAALIRTVPPPHNAVPTNTSWSDYRAALKQMGVKPAPEPAVPPGVCALGNTTDIPGIP